MEFVAIKVDLLHLFCRDLPPRWVFAVIQAAHYGQAFRGCGLGNERSTWLHRIIALHLLPLKFRIKAAVRVLETRAQPDASRQALNCTLVPGEGITKMSRSHRT
jgi:hypothetical protein